MNNGIITAVKDLIIFVSQLLHIERRQPVQRLPERIKYPADSFVS